MRGEHHQPSIQGHNAGGLSPHARGTSYRTITYWVHIRFIPACAGNMSYVHIMVRSAAVYPRMRGEHITYPLRSKTIIGLSPHARGTFDDIEVETVGIRFIPACAGNIGLLAEIHAGRTVYPRMRWEHGLCPPPGVAPGGLSPHARGTYNRGHQDRLVQRFIPACAGNIR